MLLRALFPIAVLASLAPAQIANRRYSMPAPTGPYPVGTTIEVWVDESRPELFTPEPEDHRALVVQLWYPAKAKDPVSPYVANYATLESALEGMFPSVYRLLAKLDIAAKRDAPVAAKRRRYPAVVFSHGLRTPRLFYTTQVMELASHGYVVASLDHTFDVEGVAFPDGKLVLGKFGTSLPKSDDPEEKGLSELERRLRLWASDQSFLVDQLERLARKRRKGKLSGRIDKDKIAVIGHCFGGMAALEACSRDKRFKAVVAQNAWPPTAHVIANGISQPVLMEYSEISTSEAGLRKKGVAEDKLLMLRKAFHAAAADGVKAWNVPALQIILDGGEHMSFTDEPDIAAWMSSGRRSSPKCSDVLRRSLRYTLAFLNRYLRGKRSELLDQEPGHHDGVEYTILSRAKPGRK